MKKILTILLLAILLFSCGAPKVQKDFEKMLKTFQSGDIEKIKKLFPDIEVQSSDEMSKVYLEGYKKMSFKIKQAKVNGDTAVINLDMKSPDLSPYFSEFMKKISETSSKNLEADSDEIFNQSQKIMSDFFMEKLNSSDLKYTDKNIDVYFKKNGKEWEVDYNDSKNTDYLDMITLGLFKSNESEMESNGMFNGFRDSDNLENLNTTNDNNSKDVKKANITETLNTDKIEFTVLSKEVEKKIEKGAYSSHEPISAGNSFLILTVKIKNISNSMITFSVDDFHIFLNNNKYSSTTLFTAKDEIFFVNMNPGAEIAGKIFYDIPDDVANSSNLVLKNTDDIFGKIGKIEVNLK